MPSKTLEIASYYGIRSTGNPVLVVERATTGHAHVRTTSKRPETILWPSAKNRKEGERVFGVTSAKIVNDANAS